MPNAAKSIYDIRIHSFLKNLYQSQLIIDPMTQEWLESFFESERNNYVQQFLAQAYVMENDLSLKPTNEEVEKAIKTIDKGFKSPDQKKKMYQKFSIADEDVYQWATNRLILEKFLDDMIQNRVVITEQKLKDHYQEWKSTRFLGKPYVEVEKKVHEDLAQVLLQEEFQKWVDQEKRRKKLILKSLQMP